MRRTRLSVLAVGAVAALGVIQIVPLVVIVAGLRAIELRIQRRVQGTGAAE